MELNFDKEIDAILRKARESESAPAAVNPPSHLDADEISAFAENALPANAKTRFTAHLADCDRCRKILSNVVLLNSETESEIVHADEKVVSATVIPWYRRLFQFPYPVYSLGALALVFGGLIAFTALQSLDTFQNAEVSQVSNKSIDTKSAPPMANANSSTPSANMSTANAASNSNTNFETMKPMVPANAMPKATPPIDKDSTGSCRDCGSPNEDDVRVRNQDETLAKNKPEPLSVDGASSNDATKEEKNDRAEIPKSYEDKKQAEQQPITNMPSASGAAKNARKMSEKSKTLADGETTKAGGKTFRRAGNVWYDTAYASQATTNITRGTSEYKKLDKELRVIVENLGGTVVIVWKGKAYRFR